MSPQHAPQADRTQAPQRTENVAGSPSTSAAGRALRLIPSFRAVSLLYVGIGLVVLFSIWIPDTFLTATTWKTILNEQAVTAILALGLLVPLAAGVFDLSIAWALGLGAIVVSSLIVQHDVSIPIAILLTLAVGTVVGVVNALLVVGFKIDSFIATLGSGSVITALIAIVSDGKQIIGVSPTYQDLAASQVGGLTVAVFYALMIAVALWWILELTPTGRRLYATGGSEEAARLAGVRTGRIVAAAFITSAVIATFAGLILTARLGSAAPDTANTYLLPAFAAAFLGSTQIHAGRFNVWGTVLAVYVLAIGVKGLQLAGAPYWLPSLFNGLALIVAVGLFSFQRGGQLTRVRARLRRRQAAA